MNETIPMQRTAVSYIAELMGWSLAPDIGADWVRTPTGEELLPTSELQDAWRIVNKLRADGWIYCLDNYFGEDRCQLWRQTGPAQVYIATDSSPAAAICAAAAAALASSGAAAGRAKGGQQT